MSMDLYQTITDRMIKEMEQGLIPWNKPWMASGSAVSHGEWFDEQFCSSGLD